MSSKPKSLLRPANIALFLFVALISFVGYVLWKSLQPPGEAGQYAAAMDAHLLKDQPADGPNGWDLLGAVNEERVKAEVALWGPESDPPDPKKRVDYGLLAGWLSPIEEPDARAEQAEQQERARRTLEALSKSNIDELLGKLAASRRAFRPTPTGPLVGATIPELSRSRQTARMLAARMRLAAAAGDMPARARAFEHALGLGRVTGRQAFLIDRLVGIAIVALAINRLNEDLVDFPLIPGPESEQAVRDLLQIMDRQIAFRPMRDAFEGERFGTLDTIQWSFTDDGSGDGWCMLGRLTQLQNGAFDLTPMNLPQRLMTAGGLLLPGKKTTIAKVDEFYAKLNLLCDTDRPARRAQPTSEEWVKELGYRFPLLSIMMPALEKAVQSDEQIRSLIAGTRLFLRVELARLRDGVPPVSLDEVARSQGFTLPVDPINGKEFGYRVLTGADPLGLARPYLLYSLGDDAIDNQGTEAGENTNGRYVALNAGKSAGCDFVINHSDRPKPK